MSKRLIDRRDEMATLEAAYHRAEAGQPQLVMLWGRRRTGKTFLLSHFVRRKQALFFGATQQSQEVELRRLYEAARRDLGSDAYLAGGGFADWEAALRFFVALARRGGGSSVPGDAQPGAAQPGGTRQDALVIVLDEVPYLTRSTPGFASIVQSVWDHIEPGAKLLLVLCGSAVGTMEGMQAARGALMGRPTLRLRLDPVALHAAHEFLPRLDPEVLIEAYAACGGYPLHLQEWDESASTHENLLRMAGRAGGLLVDDASEILREELPESGGYSRILAAIGRGAHRYSEIAGEAGQRVEHPLGNLVAAGFVTKSAPLGAPRGARPLYEIADAYLAFWYTVLYSDIPSIEAGQGRQVLARRRPAWQTHLGRVFEEGARAHARRAVAGGLLPPDVVVGRWWTTGGRSVEIDVLGLRGNRSALVGEARWQQRPLGRRDISILADKLKRAPRPAADAVLAFWSRGGLPESLRSEGILSFSPEDIVSSGPEASG